MAWLTQFKFRRFQGGSRAARRVKFPPANRSWRGAGGRDVRPKCCLPCSAEKLGELGDPGFQSSLFCRRLWGFLVHPAEARAGVEKNGHADLNWSCVIVLQIGRSACPPACCITLSASAATGTPAPTIRAAK